MISSVGTCINLWLLLRFTFNFLLRHILKYDSEVKEVIKSKNFSNQENEIPVKIVLHVLSDSTILNLYSSCKIHDTRCHPSKTVPNVNSPAFSQCLSERISCLIPKPNMNLSFSARIYIAFKQTKYFV